MSPPAPTLLLRDLPWQADSACLMQRLHQLPAPVFFDSGMNNDRGARYDILTACPSITLTLQKGRILRQAAGETLVDLDAEQGGADIFAAVKQALGTAPATPEELKGMPFTGGAAGYFAYDALPVTAGGPWHRHGAPASSALPNDTDYPKTPAAMMGIYHWAIIIDHQQRKTVLFILPQCPAPIRQQVLAILDGPERDPGDFSLTEDFCSNLTKAAYAVAFRRLKDYIQAGDCYQANLAQRFTARFKGSPFAAYLQLRRNSRSPFSAYIGLAAGAILSLSPERFLQVRDGQALTQPIKGTRRRGLTPEEDEALKRALCDSEKDRAENLMIVDLLRNDLGSLCETGSVRTDRLFELQSFNSVHHLVSTISAQLKPGHSPLDLLRNCFPGGSITGAPKIRAMQIIRELEPSHRSVYCGAIAYMGFDGQMDSNIAIRTLLCEEDRIHCWGGGGIVADSDCDQEYQESRDKVALLLRTLTSMNAAD